MPSPAAVASIRASKGIEFGPHKMFTARSPVATTAINPDLVYKIWFFHPNVNWGAKIFLCYQLLKNNLFFLGLPEGRLNEDFGACGKALPESLGGTSLFLLEYSVKVGNIIKTTMIGDFGYRMGCVNQFFGSMAQPDLIQAINKRISCSFLNKSAKGYFSHIHEFGYFA